MSKAYRIIFLKDNPESRQAVDALVAEHGVDARFKHAEDYDAVISDILRDLGVPAHLKGYKYIRLSVRLCIDNSTMLDSVTKFLYPAIAEKYDTTSSRVERAIRHAIEVAWDRGNPDVLQSYFGNTISSDRGKPTNSEFIALLVDKLQLQFRGGAADAGRCI